MQATYVMRGAAIDYTPSADVEAGDVVVVGGNLIGIAKLDIEDGALGALAVEGVFDVAREADTAFSAGDEVWWDADGDPEGGTAGSGAAVAAGSGDLFMGWALADAADTSENTTVRVLLWHSPDDSASATETETATATETATGTGS